MLKLGPTFTDIKKQVPELIQNYIRDILINYGIRPDEDYEDELGGGFYLCQNSDDLKQIKNTRKTNDLVPQFASLATAADSYDYADWLDEAQTFAAFLMIWNNAGGSTYFIPKSLMNENAYESIALTQQAWS